MSDVLLAVGTYTQHMPHVDGKGEGIHLLRFNPASASLSPISVFSADYNPSYLTYSRGMLYAVREVGEDQNPGINVFALNAQTGMLSLVQEVSLPGSWPCHVQVDERTNLLVVANYLSGEGVVLRLDEGGLVSGEPTVLSREGTGPNAERQEAPHAHGSVISPDGKWLYLADLGIDAVVRHPLKKTDVQPAFDLKLPAVPGAGPRHVAFTPSGNYLLANFELSSSVALFQVNGDLVRRRAEVSALPTDFWGESGVGGMHIHPTGRFVYVANRGHDSLFAAEIDEVMGTLRPIGNWSSGGRTPRDFAISPCGNFLLCAAQDDPVIRIFRIDQSTGVLSQAGEDFVINSAVCLHFITKEQQ